MGAQDGRIEQHEQSRDLTAAIGDLDCRRNLKIRTFVGFVLTPVFRDLQPRLNYADMGRRGVTPMQYYQDFVNHPAPYGYGDEFSGHYAVRLCRSIADEPRGPDGEMRRVERLILETRATLTGLLATGEPAALGYQPELGASATAGTGRVLHVLTRPKNPPGQRWVSEIPPEIDFLEPRNLDGPYPTIQQLSAIGNAFDTIAGARHGAIWGMANADVYQHVHAREYIMAMENSITTALATAAIPLDAYTTRRARIIFRRPSFVGQSYVLSVRLHRHDDDIVVLGALHDAEADPLASAGQAAVFLRFEGQLM
jgi:acyl-CoA thioesterase FadM